MASAQAAAARSWATPLPSVPGFPSVRGFPGFLPGAGSSRSRNHRESAAGARNPSGPCTSSGARSPLPAATAGWNGMSANRNGRSTRAKSVFTACTKGLLERQLWVRVKRPARGSTSRPARR